MYAHTFGARSQTPGVHLALTDCGGHGPASAHAAGMPWAVAASLCSIPPATFPLPLPALIYLCSPYLFLMSLFCVFLLSLLHVSLHVALLCISTPLHVSSWFSLLPCFNVSTLLLFSCHLLCIADPPYLSGPCLPPPSLEDHVMASGVPLT